MNKQLHARLAELEKLLIGQAEALRQKDTQLRLIEETETFLRTALARAEDKVEEGEREIERLRAQLEKLRRMLFGTRLEKLRRQVEEAEALLKQQEHESDRYSGRETDPQVPRQLRQSRHRRPFPEHLPREINRLEPVETCCPECGGELDFLGEVSAEQLELVTSALKVIRTVRVKKACTKCDCIVEAPAPSRPIERGIAGQGLLARVMTAKFCEHKALQMEARKKPEQPGFAALMKGFLRTDPYKCILCGNRLHFSSAQAGRHATELVAERLHEIDRKRWLLAQAAG